MLGRRALGHPARRKAQASPAVTTPEQRTSRSGIEAAGGPAGVESYHVQHANGQGTRCEGTARPPRREGFHTSGGVRPEAATVDRKAPRPAKTVRAGPVSLVGT